MAQLQGLADKTEAHLNRYHAVVLEAQERTLLREGLPSEFLNTTPEELEALLLGEEEDMEVGGSFAQLPSNCQQLPTTDQQLTNN
jgi:hypothetical protein